MSNKQDPVLTGRSLSRVYGGFYALDNINISLQKAEIKGLIGSNGAGKSTLMDVLCGRGGGKTHGEVLLNGKDIANLSSRKKREQGISRSFQKTNIFQGLTVLEQLSLAGMAAEEDNHHEVIDALELGSIVNLQASEIAHGEQRRLDLALALVGKPEVLLLDEPAAGLTVSESLKLAGLLRDLAKDWSVSVLIVEHDMEVIFSICDSLTVLHLGKKLAEGDPSEVRRDPEVISAFLGSSA
ncbi:ABC transporter ATP-binding protein [Halomonas sp. HAL1]|uniref:ABC transporter ATP-binding protein n=1 Tax=Halomonas sp. HAL1 TaxID=550984 RepID=UPI00022D303A|nr:ATP-binding cassette domain-containing protein [Halomonas sp. HAL1]EHA13639.1 ABC transporter-like protein [Halomonas sp. HAL1]WKV91617.1 ATP-binding cassette domain-containing protein [Halomonas sp. HAL1]|tara:strand:- start:915 stop:1634 length:720 start_codon:yes stop_codon:yes gene_type:complete